ncbi:MAG: hypothetical protein ABI443_13500 [Chthoniobacterales bacterium]
MRTFLLLFLTTFLGCSAYGSDALFILSRAEDQSTPDTQEMELRFGRTTEKIFVNKDALLTNAQVAKASVLDGDPARLRIQLTEEGAKKFEEITKMSLNKRLAIQINGVLVSAPTVRSVVTGGVLEIAGNMDSDTAEKIAAALNKK